jgi:hypothetical protein
MEHQTSTSTSTTIELLPILCTEMARDGGASLVTSLNDYLLLRHHHHHHPNGGMTKKRLKALLGQACPNSGNGKPPKLLTFLEAFPEIFQVDRHATPHWVVLLTYDFVDDVALNSNKLENDLELEVATNRLYDKALYILRKRQSKLDRRQLRPKTSTSTSTSNVENDDEQVNTLWLLGQCTWDLHYYLRAAGVYHRTLYKYKDEVQVQVHPVGTLPWQELTLHSFESVLLLRANTNTNNEDKELVLANGKAWLKSSSSSQPQQHLEEDNQEYLRTLDELLTQLVDDDGATQVRLELLLHRHETLKNLLGGRDLWKLIGLHRTSTTSTSTSSSGSTGLFQSIDITQEGSDGAILLQSQKQSGSGGRMKVDDVGLYSVTNTKWGTAIANTMVRSIQHQQIGWNLPMHNMPLIAIDLTASVGGMTLALAKTRCFQTVIAIEIDPGRADLCRQNMIHHRMEHMVQVRTMDAMDVIPTLPSRSCVVIDPPWGGVNYKQPQHQLIKMGKWSLEDIVEQISLHLTPCVLGIRLPLQFAVDDLLRSMRDDRGLFFDTLSIKKLSVQLFVVLAIHER